MDNHDVDITYDVYARLGEPLESGDAFMTIYMYRNKPSGQVIKHYLLKCPAWPGLIEMFREAHHGGALRIMIRRKRIFVFRGDILIETPIRCGTVHLEPTTVIPQAMGACAFTQPPR